MKWQQSAWAICRFELGVQRREPATVLYAVVFLLLTLAFITSGTVELVRDRGALPKLSPLAISLALGGLTAFGQVITTMITASAILRDRAWRTDQLLFTTPISHSAWVVGRWLAALLTMCAVYSALMSGVLVGAFSLFAVQGSLNGNDATSVISPISASDVIARTIWAWITLTVPTTAAVATILVTVAVRTRHLLGVLSAALLLVFVWQGCEAIVRHAAGTGSGLAVLASLADPFGTSALQVVTASWTDAERATRLVPFVGLVGASRMLWLMLALLIGSFALRPMPYAFSHAERTSTRNASDESGASWISAWPFFALVQFTLRWTWRERGWLVIATLGVLNVVSHTVSAASFTVADPAGVVALVGEHARLFLILLATIYAGEILWRDVDERVVELVHSAPVSSTRLVLSRVSGVMIAQLTLVLALTGSAWASSALLQRVVSLPLVLAYGALWLFIPFALWLVLSLAVHVAIGNKIAAHLLLIAGWVIAFAINANGWAESPWIRFGDLAPLAAGSVAPVVPALQQAAWWCTVSALLLVFTVHRWRRVTSPR